MNPPVTPYSQYLEGREPLGAMRATRARIGGLAAAWMVREARLSGRDAVDAFLALSRMNTGLFVALSDADRQTPFAHPEYGALTIDWLIYQMAGHQIHHLKQLEVIS